MQNVILKKSIEDLSLLSLNEFKLKWKNFNDIKCELIITESEFMFIFNILANIHQSIRNRIKFSTNSFFKYSLIN